MAAALVDSGPLESGATRSVSSSPVWKITGRVDQRSKGSPEVRWVISWIVSIQQFWATQQVGCRCLQTVPIRSIWRIPLGTVRRKVKNIFHATYHIRLYANLNNDLFDVGACLCYWFTICSRLPQKITGACHQKKRRLPRVQIQHRLLHIPRLVKNYQPDPTSFFFVIFKAHDPTKQIFNKSISIDHVFVFFVFLNSPVIFTIFEHGTTLVSRLLGQARHLRQDLGEVWGPTICWKPKKKRIVFLLVSISML